MREIKFKAFYEGDVERNIPRGIYDVVEIRKKSDTYDTLVLKSKEKIGNNLLAVALYYFETKWNKINILQFTGLKDKNGKEIYEFDICELLVGIDRTTYLKVNKDIRGALGIIEMKNAAWGFRPLFPKLVHEEDRQWTPFWKNDDNELGDLEYFTKIGNKFENPELLKGEGKD